MVHLSLYILHYCVSLIGENNNFDYVIMRRRCFSYSSTLLMLRRIFYRLASCFFLLLFFHFEFFKYKFIYFNWRLITLKYCIGFAIHQHESATAAIMVNKRVQNTNLYICVSFAVSHTGLSLPSL